jgi:CRP/FNR family transcriptional regulator
VNEPDLRHVALFTGVSPSDLEIVERATRIEHFPPGARIFDMGDPVRGFYLVRQGMVKIFRGSPSGQEQVLAVMSRGQTFAEAALFMKRLPASAESVDEVEVLFIERDALLDLLGRDPELALRMIAGMASKLRQLVHLVDDLTLRDARGRICRYILGLTDEGDDTVKLPVRQALLARLLGVTGETLSRTLKALKDEGAVELLGRGQIRILDRGQLERAVGDTDTSS